MHKVYIGNEIFSASDGELLSEVLIKNNKAMEHPCGGKGICRKCTVKVNGNEELSCKYVVKSDIEVALPSTYEIISETGEFEKGNLTENLCLALDIGTTTLALAPVSVDENKIVKVLTRRNPQRAFGADVITRIEYCKNNSVNELNKVLIKTINEMIEDCCLPEINSLYVSGNTTMLHTLFNIDPSSMGVAPFAPEFIHSKHENAEALGIKGVRKIISLPSVSAFAGADIVAGMNYIGIESDESYNLLIDLGTNAEIVLFSASKVLCTSAAAGPCFEGANISCGMSATDGAVYSFKINDSGKPEIKTINETEPEGICGTGLIDIIAELLKAGIIDETGYMDCGKYELSENVCINQKDIRQYQLAKSAIYSAIKAITETESITFEQIKNVYISGGFSAQINSQNAIKTGLIPVEFKNKCKAINNSSLLGTVKYALEKNNLSFYIDNAKYINLSNYSSFPELFINNMEFEK